MSEIPSGEPENRSLPEELSKLSERGYEDSSLCKPEFIAGFDAVSKQVRQEIARSIKKLIFKHDMKVPCHPDTKYIEKENVWQLKVKTGKADHRIFLDWHQKEQPLPVILSLFHGDQTH